MAAALRALPSPPVEERDPIEMPDRERD